MPGEAHLTTIDIPIHERADLAKADGTVDVWWLGQAGFLVRAPSATILVDPYLSDTLARKYAGTEFPHVRMMPPPVLPEDLDDIDLVLCTHRHTDHMDPGTLPGVLDASPRASVVVPRAVRDEAVKRGVPAAKLIVLNAGETYRSTLGFTIHALPAAHEQLETDEAGNHLYLGYVMEFEEATVYHSGDTVPYSGLQKHLAPFHIDLGLLPVNGRDEYRRSKGVPGNMSVDEAVRLASEVGIPHFIGQHYGMFDFNTVDPADASLRIRSMRATKESSNSEYVLAEIGRVYRLWKASASS